MAVVVIGISYFSLILGELVPKRVALIHPERIAAALARFMRGMARIGAPIEWLLSATTDLILRLLPLHGEPRAGHRRGDRLHAARGGGGRPHPAGRDRDRRDGAAARRPPGQRGHDAAHPDRVSRSRRSDEEAPPADPRQRLFALSGRAGRHASARRHRPGQGPAGRLPRRPAVRSARRRCARRCSCRTR